MIIWYVGFFDKVKCELNCAWDSQDKAIDYLMQVARDCNWGTPSQLDEYTFCINHDGDVFKVEILPIFYNCVPYFNEK